MTTLKNLTLIILISLTFSCTKSDSDNPDDININKGGIYILNEGNYSTANSSLSYIYPNSEIENSLFYKANDAPLGDVAQSIEIYNNTVYMVINNSGIIYVVNNETLKFEGKFNGLVSPRDIEFINENKAYVSNLYGTEVTIIDPKNYTTIGNIDIGKSSDCMISYDKSIFVANWSAYNQTKLNNTVMVINSESDILTDSIVVGIEPNSMVIDKDGMLWVLCSGGFMNDELPSLWKIDPATFTINSTIYFENQLSSPDNLCINGAGDSLYFLNNGVYGMSIYNNEIPANTLVTSGDITFYSLGIDPITNEIYLADAIDYNQVGIIYKYNSVGKLITSFEAGIIPGDFAFNY